MNAPVQANAPAFPVNPAIGQRYGQWMWNGSMWVCAPVGGQQLVTTVFSASGTYMPSPGLVNLKVRCIGGGGGGGSAGPVPNSAWMLTGGGGGSGGYSEKTLAAALVLGGVIVTVGAGGTPGGQGATSGAIITGQGGTGGVTSFGALCVANGGIGGWGNNADSGPVGTAPNGTGGAGAAPGVGDIAMPGRGGVSGNLNANPAPSAAGFAVFGGEGGAGPLGGPAYVNLPAWQGQYYNGQSALPGTGAGGGGSVISQVGGGPLEGGSGGSGMCIVEEFCWLDVSPPADCQPFPPAGARMPISGCGPGWGWSDSDCGAWGPPVVNPVGGR